MSGTARSARTCGTACGTDMARPLAPLECWPHYRCMGTRTVTTKFDDLDESTEDVRTVPLSFGGTSVELDLSKPMPTSWRNSSSPTSTRHARPGGADVPSPHPRRRSPLAPTRPPCAPGRQSKASRSRLAAASRPTCAGNSRKHRSSAKRASVKGAYLPEAPHAPLPGVLITVLRVVGLVGSFATVVDAHNRLFIFEGVAGAWSRRSPTSDLAM
jgi:hypothetical protein